MSGIKKLANQTLWYGGSSIVARMLNYLITPYLTYKLSTEGYGEIGLLYAAIPFFNVIFTYGMETAFFRFAKGDNTRQVYSTSFISLFTTTLLFSGLLLFFHSDLSALLKMQQYPEFIWYVIGIIALDTITTLPFALLRQQERPIKYASIRITNIAVNLALTYFFISILPDIAAKKPYGLLAPLYKQNYQVGYVLLANLIASFITLLQLGKEVGFINFRFDSKLWKELIIYALPLIIVGFGGMINEVADRLMLMWWGPGESEAARKTAVGIYNGNYKLSILITLFIQAFRMGAEPFFFKQADGKNPQRTYARVMKFFVITISIMFLVVVLYLDIWKYFLQKEAYWDGLKVVPILLLANMFLGIYYNLSVWYKITNHTMYGAYITLIGAVVTLAINYFFIPTYSYMACAWATFAAYGSMMVISYIWGQKVYPVPYPLKKIFFYLFFAVAAYGVFYVCKMYISSKLLSIGIGTILLIIYMWFISIIEHKELSRLPLVGRYFRQSIPKEPGETDA